MMNYFKVAGLLLLSSVLCFSCGEDDENLPEDIVIEDSYTSIHRQICEKFGLNAEDYDEQLFNFSSTDKIAILSAVKKADERLLVMAFDSTKNQYIINDCTKAYPKSKVMAYYDEQLEYTMRYLIPQIKRVGDGFVALVGLRYTSERGYSDKVVGYFNDGNNFFSEEVKHADANSEVIEWYNNSCLLISNNTICLTNTGETKWEIKERLQSNTIYPINYDSFLDLRDYSDYIKCYRFDVVKGVKEMSWDENIEMPFSFSTTPRLSFEIVNKNYYLWEIKVKAIEMNGTKHEGVLTLNIDTGEYSWDI